MFKRLLWLTHIFFCTAILASGMADPAAIPETPAPPTLRLPTNAIPERYRLHLTVVPDKDMFAGIIDVDLKISEPSSTLWLNAQDLSIKEAHISSEGTTIRAQVIEVPRDFAGFLFDKPVARGAATLHIAYEGKISRRDFDGMFQVRDGKKMYVYTQFEPISARKAFPCFDEPSYKVPWQITLHVQNEDGAFSNSPALEETAESDGMKTVKFAETKPLPSYLVAIGVGRFEIAEAGKAGKKKTRIRIIVPQGHLADAKYPVAVTPALLKLLESYFSMPYPYEKLDELAIPLVGYAMEHPGLVTYGQEILLSRAEDDSPQRQRNYVSVAAHELAHMWFGDLVTTTWWDDIWLNEGFASWMGNKIVNAYRPEWKENISEIKSYHGAMATDALVSARQVRQPIQSNDDIINAFDAITYGKGAALLNMYESYIGEREFRKRIQSYLRAFAFRCATSKDFLDVISRGDQGISESFLSFLGQPGVPLVTVELNCSGIPRLALSQRRFLPIGSRGADDQLWKIPVCVNYGKGNGKERECSMMTQATAELPLRKTAACPTWIDANSGAAGYYRSLYRGSLFDSLLNSGYKALDPGERVSLISDFFALTRAGQIEMGDALALIPKLARDPERDVVTSTISIVASVGEHLVPDDMEPNYRRFVLGLYGARARELGWSARPGEDENSGLLRPSILNIVANRGQDQTLIEQAKKEAGEWPSNRRAVSPDMASVVLRTAAGFGDEALFEKIHRAASQTKDNREREMLLGAMGYFADPNLTQASLALVLSGEFDAREAINILYSAAQSGRTRESAYRFLKDHFDDIASKIPPDLAADLPYVVSGYCDEGHRTDAATFFKDRSTRYPGGPRILAQALESIDLCVANAKAQQASVTSFLKKF